MTNEACIRYLEDIIKLFEQGEENCSDPHYIPDDEFEYYEDDDIKKILERRKKAEDALDIHQDYIDALRYAILEVRKFA